MCPCPVLCALCLGELKRVWTANPHVFSRHNPTCFHACRMPDDAPPSALLDELMLKTTADYTADPFPWGDSVTAVKWIGVQTKRVDALTAMDLAFTSVTWGAPAAWPEPAESAYRLVLSFLSVAAIRLTLAANRVDMGGVSRRSGEARSALTALAVAHKTPLSSITYLQGFAAAVVKVSSGELPGGAVFTIEDDNDGNASVDGVGDDAGNNEGGAPSVADKLLQDALARADKLEKALAEKEDPRPPAKFDMEQMAAMAAALMAAQGAISKPGSAPVSTKQAGPEKLTDDARNALKLRKFPPVMPLSRSNFARVRTNAKELRASRTIFVGGADGLELRVPTDGNSGLPAAKTFTDGELWTGMSAFNRLFTIMMEMSEDDLPRSCLVDFFVVWRELWDSPLGTRTQKLKAMLAFFDKYADSLGQGAWGDKFDRDSRFIIEHLQGDNPVICPCCAGAGEHGAGSSCRTRSGGVRDRNGDRGARGDRDRERRPRDAPPRKRARMTNVCLSMLDRGTDCPNPETCRHSHTCPCGSNCGSARNCPQWDQRAIDAKYGEDVKQMKAARAKRRRN